MRPRKFKISELDTLKTIPTYNNGKEFLPFKELLKSLYPDMMDYDCVESRFADDSFIHEAFSPKYNDSNELHFWCVEGGHPRSHFINVDVEVIEKLIEMNFDVSDIILNQ